MAVSRRRFGLAVWIITIIALWASAVAVATLMSSGTSHAVFGAPAIAPGLDTYDRGSVDVAKAVTPSVVFIEVEEIAREQAAAVQLPFRLPKEFRRFFGPSSPFRTPQAVPVIGQGSGLVIDSRGYILTNYHVAGHAARVTVRFAADDAYPATVVAGDPFTDLAVIKIEPRGPLPAATLGDADRAVPGTWVMAVGFPFGQELEAPMQYEPTVTVGVISATHRQSQSDLPGQPIRDLIQTDAPINPGNSGGPLVNDRGEVIGVNQSILTSSSSGGNVGVGFAIAINARTKEIIRSLQEGRPIVRGQLGVSMEPLTPALKQVYHAQSGVFINDVQPGSPAARAGIEGEDIIVRYNGADVTSADQLVDLVHATKPATTVPLTVVRNGKHVEAKVTVGELSPPAKASTERQPLEMKAQLGLTVEPLPPDQAKSIGIPGGVRVTAVDPFGDAARAGVETGDVVMKINIQPVTTVAAYDQIANALKRGAPVVLRIWRSGEVYTAQIDKL